jgi:hypothetical protein
MGELSLVCFLLTNTIPGGFPLMTKDSRRAGEMKKNNKPSDKPKQRKYSISGLLLFVFQVEGQSTHDSSWTEGF